jgi:hypothetical protein
MSPFSAKRGRTVKFGGSPVLGRAPRLIARKHRVQDDDQLATFATPLPATTATA